MPDEPKHKRFPMSLPTQELRRFYVLTKSSGICVFFFLAFTHPDNKVLLCTLATTVVWFRGVARRKHPWDVIVDMPKSLSEFDESDFILFRAYRILTWVWIATAMVSFSFFYDPPLPSETWWHHQYMVGLWAIVVLSVNLPKAMVIWAKQD